MKILINCKPITHQTFRILSENLKNKSKTLINFFKNCFDLISIAPNGQKSHFYRKTTFVKLHYLMS